MESQSRLRCSGQQEHFQASSQYTDISGFPYYSGSHALYYRCRNHTGSGAGQDAYGNFVWRCIYGSQHIYWKCTELYGQVIIRRKRYQHAIVLWLHMVVIALSDTCFHHRYDRYSFYRRDAIMEFYDGKLKLLPSKSMSLMPKYTRN